MTDENWNKEISQLPLTEQKKASPAVKKWDAYAIQYTSGYLGELSCYLPPGITLSELDRVADVIDREVARRGILEKEKLYAILEAGLPETIGEACDIIQDYENHVYVPSDKMGRKTMARMLALQYSRIVLPEELKPFCRYEEYMESFPDRYMVTTFTCLLYTSRLKVQALRRKKSIGKPMGLSRKILQDRRKGQEKHGRLLNDIVFYP